MDKEEARKIESPGGAPWVHIKQEVVDGIRKALEDLYASGGADFHLSFVVEGKEGRKLGDAHFTIGD